MILADSSVWIALLRGHPRLRLDESTLFGLATCGPVLQEVFQGLADDQVGGRIRRSLEALPVLSDPVPLALYKSAADLYRLARTKGYSVRSSVACLIAAIAIHNDVPLWHLDRDFDLLSRFSSLRLHRPQ